jgi:hypothetical protein
VVLEEADELLRRTVECGRAPWRTLPREVLPLEEEASLRMPVSATRVE